MASILHVKVGGGNWRWVQSSIGEMQRSRPDRVVSWRPQPVKRIVGRKGRAMPIEKKRREEDREPGANCLRFGESKSTSYKTTELVYNELQTAKA